MKRKILMVLFILALFLALSGSLFLRKVDKSISFTEYSAIRELSIEDKIAESELIIIGEVVDEMPSKWKKEDEKNVLEASPQEIFNAGGLFTDAVFEIKKILKGDIVEKTIRVRSYIGETNSVRWENSSEPVFNKKQVFLLFLEKDIGPTSNIDSGDYVSVNSNTAVYQIIDKKAISADDEWVLEDLINYIQKILSEPIPSPTESLIVETPDSEALPTSAIETINPLTEEITPTP